MLIFGSQITGLQVFGAFYPLSVHLSPPLFRLCAFGMCVLLISCVRRVFNCAGWARAVQGVGWEVIGDQRSFEGQVRLGGEEVEEARKRVEHGASTQHRSLTFGIRDARRCMHTMRIAEN